MIIFCDCPRYNPRCTVCRSNREAYRAGQRAYRQGRSSRAKHGYRHGYSLQWTAGWEAAREANPNTAAARAKEKEALRRREVADLKRRRAELDRAIRRLSR